MIKLLMVLLILPLSFSVTADPLDDALSRAKNFDGSNADWTPFSVELENGITLMLVPAGCFTMGSTDEQADYARSLDANEELLIREQPAFEWCFEEPFWISKDEVTLEQYLEFSAEPENNIGGLNELVTGVSWYQAYAYTAWMGCHLPTEAQWEYAMRGVDSWIYPWGNEAQDHHDVASWVGVEEHDEDTWEWMGNIYESYPLATLNTDANTFVLRSMRRGASAGFRLTIRDYNYPDFSYSDDIGFRIACDVIYVISLTNI